MHGRPTLAPIRPNHERLENMTPQWAKGMQKIGPGIYVDSDGALHLDNVALCIAHGFPPTQENQAQIQKAAVQIVAEQFPQAKLTAKTEYDSE